MPVKIAVLGAQGRMGCALREEIEAATDLQLVAALVAPE
ncbi:MAG TPA: 4-hydroxy-tetrahydrodipicolinate reductase, partial [Hellea balneolensis]|nr:4-hydroxy-tetrahydrodipicolinate reductase [Hellea balneolensis]